jgi:hypothetical protein
MAAPRTTRAPPATAVFSAATRSAALVAAMRTIGRREKKPAPASKPKLRFCPDDQDNNAKRVGSAQGAAGENLGELGGQWYGLRWIDLAACYERRQTG